MIVSALYGGRQIKGRIHSLTVVLDQDIRDDELRGVMDAILHVRHARQVGPDKLMTLDRRDRDNFATFEHVVPRSAFRPFRVEREVFPEPVSMGTVPRSAVEKLPMDAGTPEVEFTGVAER